MAATDQGMVPGGSGGASLHPLASARRSAAWADLLALPSACGPPSAPLALVMARQRHQQAAKGAGGGRSQEPAG